MGRGQRPPEGVQRRAEASDRAIAFPESRGWETEGVRRDHYTIGDEHVDEVVLAYTF